MEDQFKLYYTYNSDEDDSAYEFKTENAILYRVAFIIDNGMFPKISETEDNYIYHLVIEKLTEVHEPFDNKVGNTISLVIEEFFKNRKNSLIYFCNNSDDRGHVRAAKFERWYNNSNYKEYVYKESIKLDFEDSSLYTGYLIHKENPYYYELLDLYRNLGEEASK
ncbi:TPA: DUF6169 family protein [Elizabethkingia anophelis]